MNKTTLHEGVINVPDELVDYTIRIIMRYVGNYLATHFDQKYHDNFVLNGRYITNTIDKYHFDETEDAIALEFEVDVSAVKYTFLEADTLLIGIHRRDNNSMYVPEKNAILVSVKKIFDKIDKVNVKAENPDEQDDYYELIDTFTALNKMLNAFNTTLTSIIKHELAHFIQFRYLEDKHPSQAEVKYDDYNDSKEAYLTSDIEYSPQIISAVETYKHNISVAEHIDPKEYFKYIVGINDRSNVGFVEDYMNDDMSRQFFLALKRHSHEKYKKAVKYFINNV